MAVTRLRQSQIWSEGASINDGLTPADHDGNAIDIADSVGYLASQLKAITGKSGWETAPDASIATMWAKTWMEDKAGLRRRLLLHDVTVGAANYKVLSQASGETPSRNVAYGGATEGAICAKLAGAVGSHALTEIAGSNALNPKNLCKVFDGSTGDPIKSGGRQVYALLQVGTDAVDGAAFDDSDNAAQLSFVRANSTYDDLEVCPVADIQNKTINYSYHDREDLASWDEQDFAGDVVKVDLAEPAVDHSLDIAYNGGSTVDVDDTNVDWRLTDTKRFYVSDSTGAARILEVQANSGGDALVVNVPGGFDLNGDLDGGTYKATFNGVEIGGAAGKVATASGDLVLVGADDVTFTTVRETSPIPLDDSTAGKISTLFGQSFASVAAAIKYAGEKGGVDLTLGVTVLGSNYNADVNIPGGAGGLDISSPHSIDLNTPSGVDTLLLLNGRMLYGGNGSTKNDVYAGDTPASGDIKVAFPAGVKTGDVIIAIQLAA